MKRFQVPLCASLLLTLAALEGCMNPLGRISDPPGADTGSLDIDLGLPAGEGLELHSSLLPPSGVARTLGFSVDAEAGTARCRAGALPAGDYTMALKLYDHGELVSGVIEVVKIIREGVTCSHYDLRPGKNGPGRLQVRIVPKLADPLAVHIAGECSTKPADGSLRLAAGIEQRHVGATYVWYVDGEARESGDSFLLDDGWQPGHYRIDVTAFSGDGKRAGSATTSVEVGPPIGTMGVRYDGNGNTGGSVPVDPGGYHWGDTVTVTGNSGGLTRIGFLFAGWSTSADGSGTTYGGGETFRIMLPPVILYAVWEKRRYRPRRRRW